MELIKRDDRWDLYNEDGHKIASTLDGCVNKLSLKNCQAIERGYDLDELVEEAIVQIIDKSEQVGLFDIGFCKGFQKALEILGDKKFSKEDAKRLFELGIEHGHRDGYVGLNYTNECIQSLQQTEWDVEIVMERYPGLSLCAASPEVDADNCIILKRK